MGNGAEVVKGHEGDSGNVAIVFVRSDMVGDPCLSVEGNGTVNPLTVFDKTVMDLVSTISNGWRDGGVNNTSNGFVAIFGRLRGLAHSAVL